MFYVRDLDAARTALTRYGVAVIEGFLTEHMVEQLRSEVRQIEGSPCVKLLQKHPVNKDGKVIRIDSSLLGTSQKSIQEVFFSEPLRRFSEAYFPGGIRFNEEIFITEEYEDDKPILPWHFDRVQALKFYINLVDVDETNGAFEFCLSSHREGNFRANCHILRGGSIHDIPNDIPDVELYNPTVIRARAGDLVIFDPAGFHRAGYVQKGKMRLVIRAHTHPRKVQFYGKARPLSSAWWIRSYANLSRLLYSRVARQPCASDSRSVLTRKYKGD